MEAKMSSYISPSPSTGSIVAPLPQFDSVTHALNGSDFNTSTLSYGIGQTVTRRDGSDSTEHQAQTCSTTLEHISKLDIYREPVDPRKTSIICTIGPKTNSVEKLTALRKAGMNIVRLNFSHGSYEFHKSIIDNLRKSCEEFPGAPVAIALDTKGPEIRTGMMKPGVEEIDLKEGQELVVTTNKDHYNLGDETKIYCDYTPLPQALQPGSIFYIDDGLVSLTVLETGSDWVKTKVLNPARLGSRKGVNLPDVAVNLPALSEKDRKDLQFGLDNNIDMVFASFIRKRSDVEEVRASLGERGAKVKIISKIENHEGMRNFNAILEVTDGVMVARGDLGIEIAPEKVFLAQKMMISRCNIVGKPVICATQMLESMTYNPRPTRAEISDVANAVLDGADCVMLSGETAKGNYPIEAVSIMHKICREAESALFYRPLFDELKLNTPKPLPVEEAIACSAVNAAFESGARAIIALTTSGNTARLLAKYHPPCPILTLSRDAMTSRQVHLYRGCYPLHYTRARVEPWERDVQERMHWAVEVGKARGFLRAGDIIVGIQGWKEGSQHTNTIRVWAC